MTVGIVSGEEELGIQKVCPHCSEAWPRDAVFWSPRIQHGRPGWSGWCRACHAERAAARRARAKNNP